MSMSKQMGAFLMTNSAEQEAEKVAIQWAKDNCVLLDVCCYVQNVTSEDDSDLCHDCRHAFWGAVKGWHAGQSVGYQRALEEVEKILLTDVSASELRSKIENLKVKEESE